MTKTDSFNENMEQNSCGKKIFKILSQQIDKYDCSPRSML